MKMTFIFLSMMALTISNARSYDVFFRGQGKRFIKTDIADDLGKQSIKFSDCKTISATQALCSDIAIVHRDVFEEFYGHSTTPMLVGATIVGGVATAYLGLLTFATLVGPGTQFATAGSGLLTLGSAALTRASFREIKSSIRLGRVYSEETYHDQDYIRFNMSFETYVQTLKESLKSLPVSSAPVNSTPYIINLNNAQIRFLRGVGKMQR